jgi:protein PET100, fungi type
MYILFPIGWMYYFGTNLENRFSVPDFWPSQEQSHQIPYERDEIREEVKRIARETREKELRRDFEDAKFGGVVRRKPAQQDGDGGGDDGRSLRG